MYAQVRHSWRTWPVRVIPKGRTCAAGSQHFAVLCLSATFDTTLAGTQQVHPCMLRCAILSAAVRVIPKGRTCAAGFLLFAVLCLSGTFDTTLAGTQQVHPCMLRCAIRGAHGLYALYRKADLRCWLPALRSPLFIWHFRYNARRHAAGTSTCPPVRLPCLTWPVPVIPKGGFTLLASCSSQSFVYLALSIQRSQARSKYFHVCSAAPSVAHMACTRYIERPIYAAGFLLFSDLCLSGNFDTPLAGTQQVRPCMRRCAIRGRHGLYALYRKDHLRCWLPALRSPLFIWHFRYNACRHAASTSMYVQVRHPWHTRPVRVIPKGELALLAPSSQLSALGSRLSALGSRLSALDSRLSALGSQLRTPRPQFF